MQWMIEKGNEFLSFFLILMENSDSLVGRDDDAFLISFSFLFFFLLKIKSKFRQKNLFLTWNWLKHKSPATHRDVIVIPSETARLRCSSAASSQIFGREKKKKKENSTAIMSREKEKKKGGNNEIVSCFFPLARAGMTSSLLPVHQIVPFEFLPTTTVFARSWENVALDCLDCVSVGHIWPLPMWWYH